MGLEARHLSDLERDVSDIVDNIEDFDLEPRKQYVKESQHENPRVIDFNAERAKAEFKKLCTDLLIQVDKERAAQGKNVYDQDQKVILVRQLSLLAELFKEQFRKSGEPVFDIHLVGAMRNLIDYGGLTGLVSLLSTGFHDVEEDICEKHPAYKEYQKGPNGESPEKTKKDFWKSLPKPSDYHEFLARYSEEEVAAAMVAMRHLVGAVTKARKGYDRHSAPEQTFKTLLEAFVEDMRAVYVKIADRIHNMETLQHHPDPEKRKKIARETAQAFLPLANIIRAPRMVRRLAELCMEHLNADVIEYYRELTRNKIQSRLGDVLEINNFGEIGFDWRNSNGVRDDLLDRITCVDGVESIKFLAKPISDYIDHKEFESVSVEDLKDQERISHADPMFSIVVGIESGDTDEETEDKLNVAAAEIASRFNSERSEVKRTNLSKGSKINHGVELSVFDPEVGGILKIRVNNLQNEARAKRGLLANVNKDYRAPNHLKRKIEDIALMEGDYIVNAQEKLLQSEFDVLTPSGEAYRFSKGATVADFAAEVSGDFLIGMQEVVQRDNLAATKGKRVQPFELLVENCVYEFKTSFAKGEAWTPEKAVVTPIWYEFLQSAPKYKLVKYYEDLIEQGAEGYRKICDQCDAYFDELSTLFRIDVDDFLSLIVERSNGKYSKLDPTNQKAAIYRDLVMGDISPVGIFAKTIDEHDGLGQIRFRVAHESGILEKIGHEFSKRGIMINGISENIVNGDTDILRIKPDVECGIYEVLKVMLKLKNEKWVQEIELVDSPVFWISRAEFLGFVKIFGLGKKNIETLLAGAGIDMSDTRLRYDAVIRSVRTHAQALQKLRNGADNGADVELLNNFVNHFERNFGPRSEENIADSVITQGLMALRAVTPKVARDRIRGGIERALDLPFVKKALPGMIGRLVRAANKVGV